MPRTTLRIFSAIEFAFLPFLIFRCDSITIPESHYSTNNITTINSYVQDSTFTCPDNPYPNDTYTLNQLYFKLIPEIIEGNTVAAPLPILSVLSMLTANATDTNLLDLQSKIPCSFTKIESAIQLNTSLHNGVNMESVFWGQSNYLFSTPFLNTLSLCKKARLKVVDFAGSGFDFPITLNGYLNSLSGTFEHIPFHEPDQIDSVRALFTSTFCVNTSFNSSVVEDTNCEGTFKDIFGIATVAKGIRFKKGLKTYQDSTSIVYEIALNDTSLLMYVLTGLDTYFKPDLQKILDK